MSIRNYGVLKGTIVRKTIDRDSQTPHYHLLIGGGTWFHAAINIWSSLDHSSLLYLIDPEFEHPVTERFEQLPIGFTDLPSLPNSGAIDYVRGELITRHRFRVAPMAHEKGGGLGDLLDLYVTRAINQPDAIAYVFGTRWGPNPRETDRTFHGYPIHPSDGVHDVHMNQGNPDRRGKRDDQHFHENGPWQDGAIFLHFPEEEQWVSIFLAFQSQEWETDDLSGKPRTQVDHSGRRKANNRQHDRVIRIIAALVNPIGAAPEDERVTLINTTSDRIDLKGWTILNADQQETHLHGVIEPRQSQMIAVSPQAPLGNRGGTITLVDDRGEKIDGVAYTRGQAQREGRMLTF